MGIVNVTPDSFSDGGMFDDPARAVKHALGLVADGADIVDIGGESTRPGSEPVPMTEELERSIPVIDGVHAEAPDVPISVDTRRAEVARAAVEAGASIVNDVSAAADPRMLPLVRDTGAGLVLMHMRGEPKSMQEHPTYEDVVSEVRAFLASRIDVAAEAGIDPDRLCVDPGIGFGKDLGHNLTLLREIDTFAELGPSLLVGVSRKRFVGQLSGVDDPSERVEGTAGAVAWCAARGVDIVRVHDVKAMTRIVRVVDAIARAQVAPT
jgi:dihydropteroate synthase